MRKFGVINYYFVCNFLKLLNFHVKIRVDDYDFNFLLVDLT